MSSVAAGKGPHLRVTIAVRDLVAFVWREGGLARKGDLSLLSRARRGAVGHQELQRQRPADYQAEVTVRYDSIRSGRCLRLHGRIDGVFTQRQPVELEEIKTITGAGTEGGKTIHWAQLRCYAAIYARQNALQEVAMRLTYFDLDRRQTSELLRVEGVAALSQFLDHTLEEYHRWLDDYWRGTEVRNRSIAELVFPFDRLRPGQVELMDAVGHRLHGGGRLFVEATTGLGKTMAVLYAAIQAMPSRRVDRLVYVSAKNTGKLAVLDALARLRKKGLRLRALTLKSRSSSCRIDGEPCDLDACPLAVEYYQNRKPAMREALQNDHLDYERLRALGERYRVCPFELAMDLVPFVDLVICDYHYVFDQQRLLRQAQQRNPVWSALLVDECHNLVDRGRAMYSVRLREKDFADLLDEMGNDFRALRHQLRGFLMLTGAATSRQVSGKTPGHRSPKQLSFLDDAAGLEASDHEPEASLSEGFHSVGVPEFLLVRLRSLVIEFEQVLGLGLEASFIPSLRDRYFEVLNVIRLAEYEAARFRCYVTRQEGIEIRLLCVDPGAMLRESMDSFHATVCFSGTLSPLNTFRLLLGGDESDPVLQLGSPFDPDHLRVVLKTQVDTRLRSRLKSARRLVSVLYSTIAEEPGRYLIYFSSHQYLQEIVALIRSDVESWIMATEGGEGEGHEPPEHRDWGRVLKGDGSPSAVPGFRLEEPLEMGSQALSWSGGLECLWQMPSMEDSQRDEFVRRMIESTSRNLMAFGVLGGVFGEGLDLPKGCLSGVVVVGVGYPAVTTDRNLIEAYFDDRIGDGFSIAYLVPGINRVIQACGRLIRREEDFGTVQLIDRRYRETRYRSLLPGWWRIEDAD